MAIASLVLYAIVEPQAASAQGDAEQELADRYAPVMVLVAQEEECDTDGEAFAPMSVEAVLDNPYVFLRQVGTNNPVLMSGPTSRDIAGVGEGFYLDFPGDALSPGCIYEQDFHRFAGEQPAVVYAHIVSQDDKPDQLALQYWFYWYYNDWNNKHEGDWEGIQLLFDVGTVDEALQREPVNIGYAQHEGGEQADWDSDKLERQGTHPVVYSSSGSHASYYSEALYLGRSGGEGFGCDNTGGPSRTVEAEVVVLPDSVDDPDDPLAWITFEGRWGERQQGAFNGPTGPALKERWTEPIEWHDNLRSSSVIVPAGNDAGSASIDAFCGLVEWGGAQLITLQQNPGVLFIGIIVFFALLSVLLGRTDWTRVRPLPINRRRRAGQIVKASTSLYRGRLGLFSRMGLAYVPVVVAVALVTGLVQLIPFVGALADSDTDIGLIGLFLSGIIGSVGHMIGFVIVTTAVATLLKALEDGREMRVRDAYRVAFEHLRGLLVGLVRAMVIVGVLLFSVVGIPWGLRQLIRYQFLPEAAALGGLRGQDALDRSSTLVSGRWFHTAVVILLMNAFFGFIAGAVGVLLLVALTGIPLWLFSVLVFTSSALIVPVAGVAHVLLYGDAAAEEQNLARADALTPSEA